LNLPVFFRGSGLDTPKRAIAPEEALALLLQEYGIVGTAKPLATEKDDTFSVRADKASYVLKISNPGENTTEIDLQSAVLEHLQSNFVNIPTPRLIKTLSGASHTWHVAGGRRHVRLLSFIDGIPLSEVGSSAEQRQAVGRCLATLRLALASFSHPASNRVLPWDVRYVCKLEPLLATVHDADERGMLERAMARLADLESRVLHLRTQVLHNDFSKSNVLVDPADLTRVAGVIDFGDVGTTAVAIDVSTALLNQLPSRYEEDMFAAPRDVLRGYLSLAGLTDEELEMIPHLVMGRVVARALLTNWRAKQFPDNATYILRNTGQGWQQLTWFLDRTVDCISATFSSRGSDKRQGEA